MVVMDSYLMMLYVTLEQESALKNFFMEQGWTFCKPDLTMTTDKLGPSVGDGLSTSSDTGIGPRLTGKRKTRAKQTAPVVKMAKFVSPVNNKQASDPDRDKLKNTVKLNTGDTNKCSDVPVYVNKSDVKNENFDLRNICQKDGIDDDNNEDSDIDNSYGETKEGDEDITDNSFRNVSNNEVENENVMEQAIPQIAAELRESEALKRKRGMQNKESGSNPKCITCKHFEDQAQILEKGPGLPDKDEDEPIVFICDVCGKQFINQSTYKRHLQSHEIPKSTQNVRERKWKCKHCVKVFGSESNLNEHVNRVHLKRPGEFMCHLCPKSYTRAGRLQAHLNNHFGIRPYSCRSCLATFYGKASLIEHQKKCEGGVTVRFKCQICQEYFNSSVELKHHRLHQHADVFVVSPCGKKIRWKSSLKKHTLTCTKCKDIATASHMSGNL